MNTEPQTFPDVSSLTPQQRVAEINALRMKVLKKEEISDEELRYGVRLLEGDRGHRVATSGSKSTSKKATANAEVKAKANSLFGDL